MLRAGVIFLSMIAAYAQSSSDVKVDTAQARAVVLSVPPHSSTAPHDYPFGAVLVFLEGGRMTLSSSSGPAEKFEARAGSFRWVTAGKSYVSENIGAAPLQIVEIALRDKPAGPLPDSSMDPVKVDPDHYKTEFENGQVRVLRVHYGPHEKGALHEHKLNRVVVYLTDHPGLKAGSVRISGAATHTEENSMDQSVERIAVELK